MKRLSLLVLAVACAFSAAACASRPALSGTDAAHYFDAFVDTTVSPRVDFYRYAVGKWLRAHPIPPSERSWGIGRVIMEETYQRQIAINQDAARATGNARDANAQKIGDFWFSGMDSTTIEAQGFEPLKDEFARIEAATDVQAMLAEIARLQYIGADPLFSVYIFQDEKNSDRNALHLYQGGLGLPNRDYYFDTDERSRMLRREYVGHVRRMFELLGDDSTRAPAEADVVMALETELAGASRKLEDLRDPEANYNRMTLAGVSKLAPTVRWRDFLAEGHITGIDTVIVGQPEFFRQVEKSLRRGLDDWKTYARWQLAHAFAAEAGGRYDAEHFRFYGTILNGTPVQRPRWKRVLDHEEDYLGDALGQLYVARYFSPRTKERYEKLTDDIFDAFRERIHRLDWMSDATKQRALAKLDSVTKKVGYPDHWRDYSNYTVERGSFLGNCMRGNTWLSNYYIAKLHKPVDRTEWDMTPQTYNAYYNDSNNEIVLPAAVFLLPGIADSLLDDAIVCAYAGGSTIGHEITHGFDDEGRKFDARGNLRNWWTPEDERKFKQRARAIVKQFDDYVVLDSLHINGRASEGENIADLGGMLLGWDAFTKTDEYRKGESIGGFTPAQRYFMGWAVGWTNQLRPENLAVRVKSDVHAPAFLRVNGPVSNLPMFEEAFGVRPGDPMFRPDSLRVRIW
jgi:putative endopeptidase